MGKAQPVMERIIAAVNAGQTEGLLEMARELSETAVSDLHGFTNALDMIAYHGQPDAVAAALEATWPQIQTAQDVGVLRARATLAARATDSIIFVHVAQPDATNPADPTLLARLGSFFEIDATGLAHYVDVLTGTTTRRWQLDDFVSSPESLGDVGQNLNTLLIEFMAYLHAQERVALSKSDLVRQQFPAYFAARRTGQLAPRQDIADLMRGGRPRPNFAPHEPPHPLCPERGTFEEFVSRLLHFARPQPYRAAATYELVPGWLRFLQARELIDAAQLQRTLDDLGGMGAQMAAFWREQNLDPALTAAAEKWPL